MLEKLSHSTNNVIVDALSTIVLEKLFHSTNNIIVDALSTYTV